MALAVRVAHSAIGDVTPINILADHTEASLGSRVATLLQSLEQIAGNVIARSNGIASYLELVLQLLDDQCIVGLGFLPHGVADILVNRTGRGLTLEIASAASGRWDLCRIFESGHNTELHVIPCSPHRPRIASQSPRRSHPSPHTGTLGEVSGSNCPSSRHTWPRTPRLASSCSRPFALELMGRLHLLETIERLPSTGFLHSSSVLKVETSSWPELSIKVHLHPPEPRGKQFSRKLANFSCMTEAVSRL